MSTSHPLHDRLTCHGPNALADADLLTLLLGSGSGLERTATTAARLLTRSGGLTEVARLAPRGLRALGLDPVSAVRLSAAVEIGRRTSQRLLADDDEVIGSFESVAAWARPRLAPLDHEEVWLLMVDGRNRLVATRRVAQGGLHGCALTPRDVLRPAVRESASAIVLVHNHPSGDPSPSPEDVVMTRAVSQAGEVVAIPLLDHVIVARGGAASLLELGALTPEPEGIAR
jgi:DNA repair protein RadC